MHSCKSYLFNLSGVFCTYSNCGPYRRCWCVCTSPCIHPPCLWKVRNSALHLLGHPAVEVTFSPLTKHWLPGAQSKTADVKMAVRRLRYEEEASWHVRNALPAQASRKNDPVSRTEMPQFTAHMIFYFPANIQQYSHLQKARFLTKHFSYSWERVMNWDLPDCTAVTVAHPRIVFTRLDLWKNAAWSYQKKKIGDYLWSYNDEK